MHELHTHNNLTCNVLESVSGTLVAVTPKSISIEKVYCILSLEMYAITLYSANV